MRVVNIGPCRRPVPQEFRGQSTSTVQTGLSKLFPKLRSNDRSCRINRSVFRNAIAERFVRSIKDECMDRMNLVAETSLRRALGEYNLHYHAERNHQGVGSRLLKPVERSRSTNDLIHCRERLGGLLNFYYREAA